MTIALALIGLAGVAAGFVGILLPPGERIAAALPLVVGAGVGLVTLAIGSNGVETDEGFEVVFLWGAVLGFVATCAALAALWFRARPAFDSHASSSRHRTRSRFSENAELPLNHLAAPSVVRRQTLGQGGV